MKIYKTWEVIKALTESPKLRFKNNIGSIVTTSNDTNRIVWEKEEKEKENDFVMFNRAVNCDNLHIEWTLVQQPISFMEAVKVYAEYAVALCQSGMPVEEAIERAIEKFEGEQDAH